MPSVKEVTSSNYNEQNYKEGYHIIPNSVKYAINLMPAKTNHYCCLHLASCDVCRKNLNDDANKFLKKLSIKII